MEPTLPACDLRALLAGIAAVGIDTGAVIASLELPPGILEDREGHLPAAVFGAAWQRALALDGGEDFALRVGQAVPFGAFETVDYLVASADTVADGFAQLRRYLKILVTTTSLIIDDSGEDVVVEISATGTPTFPMADEYLTSLLVARFVAGTEGAFTPERVELPRSCPPSALSYRRALGCAVEFDAPRAALHLSRATWSLELSSRDPGLRAVLSRLADRLVAERESIPSPGHSPELVEAVAVAIVNELRRGEPTIADIAARLAMSPRTLQRKLGDAGTTFREILARRREQLACHYVLTRDLSVAEVAFLLGYSDQSAFNRAFKKWTGSAPLEYRSRMAGQDGVEPTPGDAAGV